MPSTRFSPILLTPDGKALAGMINRGVTLLHLANHRLRHLQHLADADGFAFTRDGGPYVFTAGRIAAAPQHYRPSCARYRLRTDRPPSELAFLRSVRAGWAVGH